MSEYALDQSSYLDEPTERRNDPLTYPDDFETFSDNKHVWPNEHPSDKPLCIGDIIYISRPIKGDGSEP